MQATDHQPVFAVMRAGWRERRGVEADERNRQYLAAISVLWQPPDCRKSAQKQILRGAASGSASGLASDGDHLDHRAANHPH